MYRIEFTKRTKTFKLDLPYEITHMSNACVYSTESYEQAINEYRKQCDTEISYITHIDYSLISTMVELYSCNEITKERRLLKTISIQNF